MVASAQVAGPTATRGAIRRAPGPAAASAAASDTDGTPVMASTRSERVLAVTGVPSLAEAAALAAAGPDARLLVRRVAVGPATCALAISGEPA